MTVKFFPPDSVYNDGLCIRGEKDGWCEWGHGGPYGTGNTGRASPNEKAITRAKFICSRCPALEACRAWALQHPDPVPMMVAGGLTTKERRALRDVDEGIRHGTLSGYTMHYVHGGLPCDECKSARADWDKKRRAS